MTRVAALLFSFAAWFSPFVQTGYSADKPEGVPKEYQLLYQQDFSDRNAIQDFVFSDPKAWKLSTANGESALELFGKSDYKTKHRSPFNIALIADKSFGDFVLDVEMMSTIKPYAHQDMCLFFGFQAPHQYYYSHIAMRADPVKAESHAHDIFIVNDAPRQCFAKEVTSGVEWGQSKWHQVRIDRKLADGSIKVFFDDMSKPIMTGTDKTFGAGSIGFGSFDDTGKVRNIRIWGPAVVTKKSDYFQKSGQ